MKNHNNFYIDKNNRWRDKETNKLVRNPFNKRCDHEGCDNLVRSKIQKFCSEHLDWTKVSHGSSILTDDDVRFISDNYKIYSDSELAKVILQQENHCSAHTHKSIILAVRHHRRKYLIQRYSKKFYYKTIKNKYKQNHSFCEICSWNDGSVDVHHIWQVKDFQNEVDYHSDKNMISVCPNHHRILEETRKNDIMRYRSLIEDLRRD